jgi:hypothetical protein
LLVRFSRFAHARDLFRRSLYVSVLFRRTDHGVSFCKKKVLIALILLAGILVPIFLLYLGEGAKKNIKSPETTQSGTSPWLFFGMFAERGETTVSAETAREGLRMVAGVTVNEGDERLLPTSH